MEFLKSLFENGALDWEQFEKAAKEKGYKIADLAEGNYVARKKYEDEVNTLNTTITELNETISTRDTDLANLQKQIEDGSKDNKTKISELSAQVSKLQSDYDTAKTDYENKLNKQSYEFAVKEFANEHKFSSQAAKRDFINEMVSAELQMKDKSIIGATDFVNNYKESNKDAFIVESEGDKGGEPEGQPKKPMFVQPTPPAAGGEANPFAFNFSGVR